VCNRKEAKRVRRKTINPDREREKMIKALYDYAAWRTLFSIFGRLVSDFIGFLNDLFKQARKWIGRPLSL
jgi:hypothetical protein